MRVLFIIIALLGAAVFGYSLAGSAHLATNWYDVDATLRPKEGGTGIHKDTLEKLEVQLDRLVLSERRDWLVIRCIGGVTCTLRFVALIMLRKRHDSKVLD